MEAEFGGLIVPERAGHNKLGHTQSGTQVPGSVTSRAAPAHRRVTGARAPPSISHLESGAGGSPSLSGTQVPPEETPGALGMVSFCITFLRLL